MTHQQTSKLYTTDNAYHIVHYNTLLYYVVADKWIYTKSLSPHHKGKVCELMQWLDNELMTTDVIWYSNRSLV